MPRPIDPARGEARARGDKRYIAARLCPQGHRERFTISTGCCKCQELRQAEMIAARPPKPVTVAVPPSTLKAPKPPKSVNVKAPSPMALARASGAEIYIGVPCKLGHVKRYTSSGHCIICKPRKVTAPKVWEEPTPKPPKPVHVISAKARREQNKQAAEEARKVFAEANRTTKLGSLIADYRHTVEARQRSRYLDSLVRNLTASKQPKVPRYEENA